MAFNVPINSLPPYPTPTDWERPLDWPIITDTADEVQFLVADTGEKAFAIQTLFTRTTGNIYIDWGDGTIDTILTTDSTTTNHVYSTGGTPCSRGYDTFIIRIYGDTTCIITNVRHISNFAVAGGNPYYNIGVLEAYFGDNCCTTTSFIGNFNSSGASTSFSFKMLEYVKFPSNVTWTGLSNFFNGCTSLYKVIMPTSASSLAFFNSTFASCVNLGELIFPSNAIEIITLENAFSGCTFLTKVLLPNSLDSCTTFSGTFNTCYSLKNITLPSINLATNFTNTFSTCRSLQWMKFTSMPSPVSASTSIAVSQMFSSCVQLQNIYFPSTCSTNGIYTMSSTFRDCSNLKSVLFPNNIQINNMANVAQGCSRLISFILPSSLPDLTNIDYAFNSCFLLQSITLPTTVGTSISLFNTFANCYALQSVTIPSTWVINALFATFTSCVNIKTIILPNNAQNSITTLVATFSNCHSLETVVLPTSLNAVTSLNSTFNNCYKITSIALPATMNAVTTANSMCLNSFNLTSITLPTSMSSCTDFNTMFSNCNSLSSITMPSDISVNTTTFISLVSSCYNLKTLTLPTTQTSLVSLINFMFQNCGNLKTIINLDKLGSLTATPLVNGSSNANSSIISLSFNCPFSILVLNASNSSNRINKLNSLRLLNRSTGQWTGTSPQINIAYTSMTTAALNILFADIAAQGTVTSKTINITGCIGAAGLTAANRIVITSKGWTITG